MDFKSILIGSENPEKLVDFYSSIFGAPGMSEGGYTGWQIGTGFLAVGPHDQVKGRNTEPGRLLWNIETTDVRGEFERVRATGAPVVQEPYQPGEAGEAEGVLVATFEDPDGNYFQLVSPM